MRLLLVEDERKLSQVLAKGLKKLSYAVDQAFDGEEALELFSVYGYDLVVLDLNLPKNRRLGSAAADSTAGQTGESADPVGEKSGGG